MYQEEEEGEGGGEERMGAECVEQLFLCVFFVRCVICVERGVCVAVLTCCEVVALSCLCHGCVLVPRRQINSSVHQLML